MRKKGLQIVLTVITSTLLLSGCGDGINPEEGISTQKEDIIVKKEIVTEKKDYSPIQVESYNTENISYDVMPYSKTSNKNEGVNPLFRDTYTDIKGVLTFRGDHLRSSPSFGIVEIEDEAFEVIWSFETKRNSEWGGGSGWVGSPAIISWGKDVLEIMNVKERFKQKEDFTEVIYASLDGNVYFLDLDSGEETRDPLKIQNPIKGSVAVDPRGYPLLYVGQGIPQQGEIGYRIFNLIDGELLYFIPGIDNQSYRGWGAFDGSPIINKETDTMLLGGENGLFYSVKLNTLFDKENGTISVDPEETKYRYKINGNNHQGIENSVAAYKNIAYFADNGGSVQAIDLTNMRPIWALEGTDDTDATIVIDVEGGTPFLYTGTEVDKQGSKGITLIRKINGLTGEVIWKSEYPAYSISGVNGGMLATPLLGKGEQSDSVYFTIARYKTVGGGILVSIDKNTGKEHWRWEMPSYSWSSPLDLTDKEGNMYILQADAVGNVHLVNGDDGSIIFADNFGSNIESSPVAYNNKIVFGTRGGQFYGIEVK